MLGKLDTWLTEHPKRKDLHGWRRFIVEFWFFENSLSPKLQ